MIRDPNDRRGMSLVELIIVVMILGVVLAGVFLFFTKGTESFHFARRQNELDTEARMILEKITNELIWAGYMPQGGWSGDDWHPVVLAYEDSVEVYFDKEPWESLQPTDYIKVYLSGDEVTCIDRAGNDQRVGHYATDLDFTYLDGAGNDLGAPLVTEDERDQVRHIGVDLTLTQDQGGHVYQTVMHTTISPRNLGVNHDIEPLFFAPPQLKGNVAFNCAGADTNPTPTVHEQVMISKLVDYGFTINRLTDAMCDTFDYSDIDLIILRRRSDPTMSHPSLGMIHSQDSIPVITFQPQDAYLMGLGTVAGDSLADHQMRVQADYWNWHPTVMGFDSVFYVYDPDSSNVYQYGLLGDTALADSTFTSPYLSPGYAGVICNDYPAGSPGERRVFCSAYQATNYDPDYGEQLFYNLVKWSSGTPPGSPGVPFTEMEDFESPAGGQADLVLWDDQVDPDSAYSVSPIYEDYFTGSTSLAWEFDEDSPGGQVFVRTTTPDPNVLQMDREDTPPYNYCRNFARVNLDMSAYSEYSDEILLCYDTKKQSAARPDSAGVFLRDTTTGTLQKIASLDSTYTDWIEYQIDFDEAVRNCSFASFSTQDWEIVLSQYGDDSYENGQGRLWDDFVVGEQGGDSTWVEGWVHARMDTAHVDDWVPDKVPSSGLGYSWTTWANNPSTQEYSNDSWCYLQTPPVTIPNMTWDTPPKLTFMHKWDTQTNSDGGYVQIRVDGGLWQDLTLPGTNPSASDFPAGAGVDIFTGSSAGWETCEVDLSSYLGSTVEFRFVFGSNGTTVGEGWMLDDFQISGQVTGFAVTAFDFQAASAPSSAWSTLDVYMGATTNTEFTGSGEWNKASMTQVVSGGTYEVSMSGWNRLQLDQPFLLAPGQNLQVKIEVDNSVVGSGNDWEVDDLSSSAYRCRNDYGGSEPTTLFLNYDRPNVRVVTNQGTLTPNTGTLTSGEVPMSDDYQYSDCEMLYLGSELTGGGAGWTHGGVGDDWEIGYPLFTPDIDPALTPDNGNSIAGNDLTDDGYYNDNSGCWLMSPAYDMPTTSYDTVVVRYDRCIRAENDVCWVEVGFSTDGSQPDSSDWHEVRDYPGPSHQYWDNEEINVTSEFHDAELNGMNYFFIRFFLSTGSFLEDGGWNLDNIQFYGRNM
ncbi:prepilin-type N-terminal cleavage/methylation domain-containing protein [Candidatus Fermentibacteria bacterium]|nr:prepilin-type N-terminal cleavage/methylation domain-containing protein [Candidatus Fermentibacteria bacterium]